MTSWVFLFIAALFEIVWAIGLKLSHGFTRPWPTAGMLTASLVSVVLLSIAAKELPIGTAYAAWTGIGAVGTVICGIFLFQDPVTLPRLFCLALIVLGILGLKLTA